MKEYWGNFQRTQCYPNKCNCEPMNPGSLITQPISTYSNLPLFILGLFIAIKYVKATKVYILGILITISALGSTILHMSYTRIGQIMDFSGIAFIFVWIILYYMFRSVRSIVFGLMLTMLISYMFLYFYPSLRHPFIFICAMASIVILIKNEGLKRLTSNLNIIFSMSSFTLGVLLFYLDNQRVWCPENPWVMGHTMWHFLVCLSCYFIFRFFKSKEDLLDQSHYL